MSSCSSCTSSASQSYLQQMSKQTQSPVQGNPLQPGNNPSTQFSSTNTQQSSNALNTSGSVGRSLNVTA